MFSTFDPYHKRLGIPHQKHPPLRIVAAAALVALSAWGLLFHLSHPGHAKADPKSGTLAHAPNNAAADEANAPKPLQGSLVPEKQPVPDAAALDAARKKLKELFKNDYALAKKPEGKLPLANSLFSKGQEVDDDPPTCYVMLTEAADMAAAVGNLDLSWKSLMALGKRFEVDHLPMMERAARSAAPFAKTFDEVRVLVSMYSSLTNEAIRANDFETATKVMQAAAQAVRKPPFAQLKDQVTMAGKRVTLMKDAFEPVRAAHETLKTKPTDPIACLAWGRFLCFHKNDWAEGLPLLALAADPVLSPLAQREIGLGEQSAAPESSDFARVGDDWWAVAEKEKEPVRTVIRDHAAASYLLAQDGVTGLDKTALQQKVERMFGTTKFVESPGDKTGISIAPAELNPGKYFTIEFWVSTQAASGPLVSKRQLPEGETSIVVSLQDGIPSIASNADNQWEPVAGQSVISDGAWHHVAAVKTGEQLLLFIDGKLEVQVAGRETYSSESPWKAGCSTDANPLAARLCRIRISSTPRYLLPFTPDKQYGKDTATLYPK